MKDWSYFNKFDREMDMYLPASGEGDNMATQIVTAVSKLVYKWYNDGDVFDNTAYMEGWCNDLSSYANWLARYVGAADILDKVFYCYGDSEYEDLLAELADSLLDAEDLERWARKPARGSIYDCDGRYKFEERMDDDEDEDEW